MPKGQIEHANISVSQPERHLSLLCALLGWEERWRGKSKNGGDTIHVGGKGDGATYIALYTDDEVEARGGAPFEKGEPFNHVGLLVDDLDAAEKVVAATGLEPFGHDDYEPGRRFYFHDWDGIEFEVVSYAGQAS